ncbi:nucleotidyltransferase domain-containing protein [Candidatus Margulisiibacteriota bacterium]
MVQQELLTNITEKLESNNIQYMLTGSMASNYYGTPRMTHDIDIVIQISASQVQKFHQLFKEDYYISTEAINKWFSKLGLNDSK